MSANSVKDANPTTAVQFLVVGPSQLVIGRQSPRFVFHNNSEEHYSRRKARFMDMSYEELYSVELWSFPCFARLLRFRVEAG